MRIHYLQHVSFENPGTILNWADARNHTTACTKLYETINLPEMNEFDWLVIMGGPMNIYEEQRYPWLAIEKAFIKKAIKEGKVVLGLCLGAQLIADVIGGRVVQNKDKEIGWLPVMLSDSATTLFELSFLPRESIVFEWHGDTFIDLPEEAILLASNIACKHQAFLYKDRVYGFQFHLEITRSIIENLLENCSEDLVEGPYVQSTQKILEGGEFMDLDNQWMNEFLTRVEEKWNFIKDLY